MPSPRFRHLLLALTGAVVLLATALPHAQLAAQAGRQGGAWSASARRLDRTVREVPSPNGRMVVRMTDMGLVLVAGARLTPLDQVVFTPGLTEVLWSPDSLAVAVTASDRREVATWTLNLFTLAPDGRVTQRDLTPVLTPYVRRLTKCDPREEVNFGAAAWLREGRELLVLIEVPPHSSCSVLGTVAAVRLAAGSWKAIEGLSGTALRSRFGSALGVRFAVGAQPR